jgi:hypothetical protein
VYYPPKSLIPLASGVLFVPNEFLCFRGLASTTHMAKECKLPVKCTERESDKNLAALHIDRNPKPKDPEEVHGGEQSNGQQDGTNKMDKQQSGEHRRITTTCTESSKHLCQSTP